MTNIKINHTIVKDISFSLLEEGISVKVRADGYSMYPTIRPGSYIHIEPLNDNKMPATGEIVAWKRDSGFVVHRLVRIVKKENEIWFVTRGDSCTHDDMPVQALAGKVVRIENEDGTVTDAVGMSQKPGYVINRLRIRAILLLKKIIPQN
jgi:signal peptidase I